MRMGWRGESRVQHCGGRMPSIHPNLAIALNTWTPSGEASEAGRCERRAPSGGGGLAGGGGLRKRLLILLQVPFSVFFDHRFFQSFDFRSGILTQNGEPNSTYLRVVLSKWFFLHLALRGRIFDSLGSLMGWFWGAPGSFWASPGAVLVQNGTLFLLL